MKKRDFGKRSGYKVPPVNIGAMRLPGDVMEAVKLIRHAIDSGMQYIDTSRGYEESEFILAKALKNGYRKKVILSTKCSPWNKKVQDTDDGSAASVLRRIEESILRLDVEYLDFYQIWSVESPKTWKIATREGGMVDGIKKAIKKGLVRHAGFTTHNKPENVISDLNQADWCEVILVSYNLLSKEYKPVLEAAHKKGIGTLVMNPVGGGKLAEKSSVLMKIAKKVGAVSVPDLAVRYVLSNPDVDTILCGMRKISDVDDTIASAERPRFSRETLKQIDEYFDSLSPDNVGFCTSCNYCMPCPAGINIPGIMRLIYEERYLGFKKRAKNAYKWSRGVKADACTKCGECEKKCTQKLKIMKEMKYAVENYGKK